ncbi:MAG: P-loop NTPase [Euryarchaeota archaeon]|nr:P-loop NTPase [Euryarchaeota archaeon]
MKITVTGGKGGTGKSTVATNLAWILSKRHKVVLVDADVECPDDYILLNSKLDAQEDVNLFKPKFNYDICTGCGLCVENCSENALVQFKNGKPFLMPTLCSGCFTCKLICPEDGAILDDYRLVGYTYRTRISDTLELVTGLLAEGEERSYPTVLAARRRAMEIPADIHVFDTMPGTGNHVAAAIEDSKVVITVSEPTPLGEHDLEMILKLLNKLNLKAWIVVNRSDIGDMERHRKIAEKYGGEIIAEIPMYEEIMKSYVAGVPVVEKYPESEAARIFESIAKRIEEVL